MEHKIRVEALKPFGNRAGGAVFSTFPWRAKHFKKKGLAADPGQAPQPDQKKAAPELPAKLAGEAQGAPPKPAPAKGGKA